MGRAFPRAMRRPAGVRVRGSLGRTQLPCLILILSLLQLAATAGSHASGSSAADENQHGRNGIAGRSGGSREAHTRVMPAKESHEMSREAKVSLFQCRQSFGFGVAVRVRMPDIQVTCATFEYL